MGTTKIERLRKKYADANINIVDLVRYLDPTKQKVLVDVLASTLLNVPANPTKGYNEHLWQKFRKLQKAGFGLGDIKDTEKFFDDNLFRASLLLNIAERLEDTHELGGVIKRFGKYWEEKKIPHNFFQTPKTIEDVKNIVEQVEISNFHNQASKQVHTIYQDGEWLVLIPLSLRAAQVYGANTQWCTSSKTDIGSYFNYTSTGLLIYIINKKKQYYNKFAYYRKLNEKNKYPGRSVSEFYDSADQRIDSLDVDVPEYILKKIKNFEGKFTKNIDFPNYNREEWEEWRNKNGEEKCLVAEPHDAPDYPEGDENPHPQRANQAMPIVARMMEGGVPEDLPNLPENYAHETAEGYEIRDTQTDEVVGIIPHAAVVNATDNG